MLPTGPIYSFLEDILPHPSLTYQEVAQIVEFDEKETINKLIGERRTNLGAKIGQVTIEVRREVINNSEIESLYTQIINYSNDDEIRRQYEEKLLQRYLDVMIVLPRGPQKDEKRAKAWELATGMVIIKHPYKLAWEITLEWQDPKNIQDLDVNVLREYCAFFPKSGLALVLLAYMSSELSLFPPPPLPPPQKTCQTSNTSDSEEDEDEGGGVSLYESLNPADRMLMISEGISESGKSILAHRLTGKYYQHLEEYETAVELLRSAQRLIQEESAKTGLKFENSSHHIAALLGTALVYYQSPKNHPEAKSIFEKLLEKDSSSTPALIGIGLIYEEEEEYDAAIKFFDRALMNDGSSIRIKTEAAWAKALSGDYATGKKELYKCLSEMDRKDLRYRDLLAQTQYRYGVCLWNVDATLSSRKDRNGAYAYYLAALKTNASFAPAYTSLGIYYADYCKDNKRAEKCFQKAFELSSSEVESAERLVRIFAGKRDWELVEVVARRVVDSGKVRPAPGSKKKGICWPFSALAVAELNKQEYAKSIASFQSALRISPDDYHCWVGLGESYHNCGRYIAATKALEHALNLEKNAENNKISETWFAKHMLANVKRELGDYNEAIMGYRSVLCHHEDEYGVSIALIQALVESAFDGIEKGLFGYAVEKSIETIDVALTLSKKFSNSFNLWKAVGDACCLFSRAQNRLNDFPIAKVREIIQTSGEKKIYDAFSDIDGVDLDVALATGLYSKDESCGLNLTRCIHASILAHKRALYVSANDKHAQAVAFYNLGWVEYQAHIFLCGSLKKRSTRYLKASVRCFKRSIETEAGNSEFWNAFGAVTSQLNPKIAQHSFVRSLYLNERSAQTWTNLGTLYLLQKDYLLANKAYTRAQSSDPDYPFAWVGQAFLALILTKDKEEAHILSTHAMEISVSSLSALIRKNYAQSFFDQLSSSQVRTDVDFVRILFILRQLESMTPNNLASRHLITLFLERGNDFKSALAHLSSICSAVELDYELTESTTSLSRFALAKADLARCQLCLESYKDAIENGETALQLSTEDSGNKLSEESRKKCRLSIHLTMGLAHYYLGSIESAFQYFLLGLEESNGNPDALCLLAQVLWARGDEESRNSARNYLFDCVESHPDHIQSILILGVIAVLDDDYETLEAVITSLNELRMTKNMKSHQRSQIGEVLQKIAALSQDGQEQKIITEIQTQILLEPSQPYGWSHLTDVTGNPYTSEMALKIAAKAVTHMDEISAVDLSKILASTRIVGDAQKAVMNAPWNVNSWDSLFMAIF